MSDDTDTGEETAENLRNSAHAHGEPADRSTEADAADAFRALQPGETISVHRLSPSYAQGYLDHIVVPHGEELDVMSELKSNWGGGRYQLKAKRRATNGKMVFSGVNATVVVAGEPTLDGQVYRNGRLVDRETASPTHAAPQVVYAQPQAPTANPMDPINARILGMVESALTNGGPGAGSGTDIVGLIGALRETLQPARPAPTEDPFKNMERTLQMLASVRETFAGENAGAGDGAGMTGLGSGVEAILMQKILGGPAPAGPQQPPPWQQPTQQWMQGQWGGPPQGPPGGPPMGGSPPPHNWQNPQGPVPWQNQPGSHGAPPPPGWRPPEQPSAPQSPPPPSQPPPPQQAETHDQNDDDDEDEGPYTVDNLMGELEGMQPDERGKFVEELAKRFGIDQVVGKKLFPNGVPQTQNAAGESIPDFSGMGPMPGTNPQP